MTLAVTNCSLWDMCVTWLIHMCDMTHSHVWTTHSWLSRTAHYETWLPCKNAYISGFLHGIYMYICIYAYIAGELSSYVYMPCKNACIWGFIHGIYTYAYMYICIYVYMHIYDVSLSSYVYMPCKKCLHMRILTRHIYICIYVYMLITSSYCHWLS